VSHDRNVGSVDVATAIPIAAASSAESGVYDGGVYTLGGYGAARPYSGPRAAPQDRNTSDILFPLLLPGYCKKILSDFPLMSLKMSHYCFDALFICWFQAEK
jgi:hypothetical protein